jgi:hypothetical protein
MDVLRLASRTDVRTSQIRQGIAANTKGTAFVVYEDVMDAKQACDKLNGFNFQNRYLVGRLREFFMHYPLHAWSNNRSGPIGSTIMC